MRRRDFITPFGVVTAWPLAAQSQQGPIRRDIAEPILPHNGAHRCHRCGRVIVGKGGCFIGVREMEAFHHKAALRKAKQYAWERDVEVWQRERRFGRIASADLNPVVQLALRRLAQKRKKT
jgi:hypothetical protein